MGRTGKGLTTSLALMTKSSNNKQKERFTITDITNQDLRNFLKKFNNSPYLGYKSKQVHNEPTEPYFFPIKSYRNVQLCTNKFKLGVNEKLDTSTKQFNLSNWKAST